MRETAITGIPENPMPEHLSPMADYSSEAHPIHETAQPELGPEELKAAYDGWLERRDIDPASVPHIKMDERAFLTFKGVPLSDVPRVRGIYEIPSTDQYVCQYAFIDVEAGDLDLPPGLKLVKVTEDDFGTALAPARIAKDFQPPDPDSPPSPDSAPAYVVVDIGNVLVKSYSDLKEIATEIMQGQTEDPFRNMYGDVGVRAGGLAPGQEDAYVWTTEPIKKAVELTLLSPSTYDSVCVVHGQKRPAGNGKHGMAQIVNPTVKLKIAGEALEKLQKVYKDLYNEPGFALTEVQRVERSQVFNSYVMSLISEAARTNSDRADDEDHARRQLQVRYREYPPA